MSAVLVTAVGAVPPAVLDRMAGALEAEVERGVLRVGVYEAEDI
jgi:hypothetical protein